MGYWLNHDSTRVTLHREDCRHAEKWARPPKWERFENEEKAGAFTGRDVHLCHTCVKEGRLKEDPTLRGE